MKKILSIVFVTLALFSILCSSFCATATEHKRKMKIGDLITNLPNCTYSEETKITDNSNIENGEFSLSWKPFEGASSYSVRAFFNINYMDKKAALNFLYEAEFTTDTPSVTVNGLQRERRYTIVVYAFDTEGNEIAVYDRLPVFTYPVLEIEDELVSDGNSVSESTILIIAASIVGGLIVVAVIVLLVVLIKTRNHGK